MSVAWRETIRSYDTKFISENWCNYHKNLPCLFCYFAVFAGAVVDDPDDVVAGAKEPGVFFFYLGEFLVDEEVAEFFSTFHAEGGEGVAGFGFSDGEREGEFVVVEASPSLG